MRSAGPIWALLVVAVVLGVGLFLYRARAQGDGYGMPSFGGREVRDDDFDYHSLFESKQRSLLIRMQAKASRDALSSFLGRYDEPEERPRQRKTMHR